MRKYTQYTLLSIYPQWTCLGTHDMLSKPLLLLSQAFLNIYVLLLIIHVFPPTGDEIPTL